jgi:hypothetical protein
VILCQRLVSVGQMALQTTIIALGGWAPLGFQPSCSQPCISRFDTGAIPRFTSKRRGETAWVCSDDPISRRSR